MPYKSRAQRYQTEKLPVSIRLVGTFSWSRGVLLNLSAGGAQIFSQSKYSPDAAVEIEFTTISAAGKTTKSRLIAKVVWFSGNRYGVQFKKKIRRS